MRNIQWNEGEGGRRWGMGVVRRMAIKGIRGGDDLGMRMGIE